MKPKRRKQGFTLVEIMIVVAIIGLLAAMGIPSIVSAYSNAQDRSMERNITDVEKAKAQMTLPAIVSGIVLADGTNVGDKTVGDTVSDEEIVAALNIENIDALDVGNQKIQVNAIGTRASYVAK